MPLHLRRRTRQRGARVRHLDPRPRKIRRPRALRDNAERALRHHLSDEAMRVELRALNRHEETPGARLARIVRHIQ
jgi:hypothetical protein